MAHMINGRDGQPKRLGIKLFGGQAVKAGNIILKQNGMRFKAGANVGVGRDNTLFAMAAGFVEYRPNKTVNIVSKNKK